MGENLMQRVLDIIDVDFPISPPITKEVVENIKQYAQRNYVGNVRMALGLILTDEEFEKRKRESYLP